MSEISIRIRGYPVLGVAESPLDQFKKPYFQITVFSRVVQYHSE